MPNKGVRFTDSEFEAINTYRLQTNKTFSNAVRSLISSGLREHQALQSLGITNINEVAKTLPIHEKKRLKQELITTLMVKKMFHSVAKSESPEALDKVINEEAEKILNEEYFS